MKKIIIKKCYRCHFHEINSIGEEICKYWDIPKDLEYENYENFPDWCPLKDEDYTIFDYAHDYLIHYTQMPTEEDLEYMAAEAKIEEKLLERG